MDFLLPGSIQKMPKIPDKNNFYSFPSRTNPFKEIWLNSKKWTIIKNIQCIDHHINTLKS